MFRSLESESGLCSGHWSQSRGYVQATGVRVGAMMCSLESDSGLCSSQWCQAMSRES